MTATELGAEARPLPVLRAAERHLPPTLLAPMEGLTSKPFRDVIEALSRVGAVYTEFVSENKAISRKVARREVRPGRSPLIVQLLGGDPAPLARATGLMIEAGADGIDLNVGCPSSCVTRGARGAALLKDRPRLARILQAMVAAAGDVPVSAKVRAGWDDPGELLAIARVVEDAGARFLTVHARTFRQKYEGRARLDLIAAVREHVSIPVVANGDIVRASDAVALLREGRADGVMIGRGAVRNPWVFAQIDALWTGRTPPRPTAADLVSALGRFERSFAGAYGPGRERGVLSKLKEVIAFLGQAVRGGDALREACRRSQSLEAFHEAIDRHLRPLRPEAVELDA